MTLRGNRMHWWQRSTALLGLAGALLTAGAAHGEDAPRPAGKGRLPAGPREEALSLLNGLQPEALLKLARELLGEDLTFHQVGRGQVASRITERGSVEAVDCGDVVCRVKARGKGAATTIKWVIDDGTQVKKGDRLLVLDDSALLEELRAQKAAVEQARAAQVQAAENLQIVKAQNGTEVRLAEIAVQLAELEAKREGGKDPDRKKFLELKTEQARLLQDQTRARTRAKEVQAQAELQAKAAALEEVAARRAEIEGQVSACVLNAPQDGLAVYHVPEGGRFGAGNPQAIVAAGEPVREGQKLLRVCDLTRQGVRTRVHEALVSHVRAKQAAAVRVDAFPDKVLKARVSQVATVASQADWLAADVKVYPVFVSLDETPPGLKPGMSAEVRILIGERRDVVRVPPQALVQVGRKTVCFVRAGRGLQAVEVTIGLADDVAVEIREGLKEGDQVLRNPRALLEAVRRRAGAGGKQSQANPAPRILVRSVPPPPDEGARRSFVRAYGLTYQDLDRIAGMDGVSQAVPVRAFPQEVRFLDRTQQALLVGTTPAYAAVNRPPVAEGRFLSDEDDGQARNVAVLGAEVAERLFGNGEPLGRSVAVQGNAYVVIGVLGRADPAGLGEINLGEAVVIPLRTCRARFGERVMIRRAGSRSVEAVPLTEIQVTAAAQDLVPATADAIRALLRESHEKQDWEVRTPGGR